MKRQDYIFGSTTDNITQQSTAELNTGWQQLAILYSKVLNGVLNAISSSTNDCSQELSNAIVAMGKALDANNSSQLAEILQSLAIKATDFASPITASNKGATMNEIEELKTITLRFVGFVSPTQPTQEVAIDDLWINATSMPSSFPVPAASIKRWTGTAWVDYGQTYSPTSFDFFRNNNDGEGYYWFGGEWKVMSTDMSTDYFYLNPNTGKWEINQTYDNTLVHKSGAETIDGIKTLLQTLILKTTTNTTTAGVQVVPSNDGSGAISLVATDNSILCSISFGVDGTINISSTNSTITIPTPSISETGDNAINASWFASKMQVVDALPASPTAGVFYFVKE